jgi:hypothetical protein
VHRLEEVVEVKGPRRVRFEAGRKVHGPCRGHRPHRRRLVRRQLPGIGHARDDDAEHLGVVGRERRARLRDAVGHLAGHLAGLVVVVVVGGGGGGVGEFGPA